MSKSDSDDNSGTTWGLQILLCLGSKRGGGREGGKGESRIETFGETAIEM